MSNLITQPGLYRISPAIYHADKLMDGVTLSSGCAKEFIDASPFHAKEIHPRLATDYDPDSNMEMKRRTAFGSAGHELMLGIHDGDGSLIDVIDADSYSKGQDGVAKANREARDKSILAGRFPLLKPQFENAQKVVEAAKRQENITKDYPGDAEICGIANLDGVWCRCLCDWLTKDRRTIIDVKFTERRMNPSAFNKHAISMGYDISQAHYRAILAEVEGVSVDEINYVFLVIERGPPVVATLMRLAERNAEKGLEKAAFARMRFRECLKTGSWPGYSIPGVIAEGEPVDWDAAMWERRVMDSQLDIGSGARKIHDIELMEA